MAKRKNSMVFMDVSVDGDPAEKMVFELFFDIAPKTAENFRALCTGEKGIGPRSGRPLHYKGSFFHRIVKGYMAQGGDFVKRDGTGGESIYGGKFPDELPRLKHGEPGLLSMPLADRDSLGSHFIVTFAANHSLDRKHIVFGKLVHGHEVLRKIEEVGEHASPPVTVKIINCGEYDEDKKRVNKLRSGKDASSDANSHEARRKGKHKKSYRDKRRKRRRHYSSDSESSSDSDLESSESDTDSESDLSSSSYTSSSSDDRRKRKKKSWRRDKYKRGKRRDKRRDRKRRRRDKRSKRRSRRASESSTDTESENESKGTSEGDGLDDKEKVQKHKKEPSMKAVVGDNSPVNGEMTVASAHHKRMEEAKEDGRSIRENGEQRSNGVRADFKSDRIADRQPDIVDDHPGKSRSRSLSPKRTASKSMSISPRRSLSKSPSVSPKRRMSRSPILTRSPPPAPQRSRSITRSPGRADSRSPASGVSRSPERGWTGRSISASPVRMPAQRSISRSRSPRSPIRSSRRSPSRSPMRSSRSRPSRSPRRRSPNRSPRKPLHKSISRSPVRAPSSRSTSPVKFSQRSGSRILSKDSPRRSISRSPRRELNRNSRRSYSRSPSSVRRVRLPPSDRERSLSRSVSPDGSPKRIRRGRGFSQRYSYARRYRTPSSSPARSYRFGGRSERDRYLSYRRYSPRRYRSPPRGRTPLRYRSRRSRTPSASRSPPYRSRRYSHSRSPIRSRSPVRRRSSIRSLSRSPIGSRSQSPIEVSRSRESPRVQGRKTFSRGRSPSESSSSLDSQSPKQKGKSRSMSRSRSRSSSGSLGERRGLVSYGDGSPDSSPR